MHPLAHAPWWLLALAALALGAVALVALWAHLRFWVARLAVSLPYALEERIATPDGSRIELRRLPPVAPPAAARPPVLLVHGLAANHRNIDLNADLSLARTLAASGRDVWLVTLRSGVARRTRAETHRVRFGSMARYDLPLAVDTILARTGAAAVDFVGFSMGGMLLYAALGRGLEPSRVRRAAVIGSPAVVRGPLRLPAWLRKRVPLALVPTLNLRFLARTGAFASEWLRTPAHRWVLNSGNVARGISRMALVNMVEDVPGPLGRDFATWILADGDGGIEFEGQRVLDGLATLRIPALFIAGAADRLAPPSSVRAAFDAWGSAVDPPVEKAFLVLGRAQGSHADYGHGDLAVGEHARDDVFAPVAAFLAR